MADNRSGRRPQRPPESGDTRPFRTVKATGAHSVNRRPAKSRDPQLAREKQRRQYEQQKKEQIVFLLFVVVLIALILVAILVFKKAMGNDEDPNETQDTGGATTTEAPDTSGDIQEPTVEYRREMRAAEDVGKGLLILLDPSKSYKGGDVALENIYAGRTPFKKGEKTVYSYYTPDTTPTISAETLAALNQMADDFYGETGNNDLYVDKAYDAAGEHASGNCVDLSVYTIDSKHYLLDDEKASEDFEWVFANYYKYGFVMQTPAESGERYHHFRYVGKVAAALMHEKKLDLAGLVELLKSSHSYVADSKIPSLSYTAADGAVYELYYVAASGGDMTGIPIPEGALHTEISGDNDGGFIAIVRMS